MNQHNEYVISAIGGVLFGVSGGWAMNVPDMILQMNPLDFAFHFPVKAFATFMLAIIGGVAGMFGRDLYTHLIKPRIKKFKNEEK